jgi:hypothetical protein
MNIKLADARKKAAGTDTVPGGSKRHVRAYLLSWESYSTAAVPGRHVSTTVATDPDNTV